MRVKKTLAILIVLIILSSNFMPIAQAIESSKLTSKRYKVNNVDKNILRVEPETTLQEFKNNFYEEEKITVYKDKEKQDKITSGFIGTEMVLEYNSDDKNNDYQISVIGDLNGNGKIEQLELTKTIRHIVGQEGAEITGIQYYSADITGDGLIDQRDIGKYIRYIVEGKLEVDLPDIEAPRVAIEVEDKTETTIEVSVLAEDNGDGLETNPIYNYYIKESTKADYEEAYSGKNSTYEFSGLMEDTEYNIKVTVNDKSGNVGEKVITVKTVAPEKDENPPEVTIIVENTTSRSIRISVSAEDDVEMPEVVKYKYYIKNGATYSFIEETTEDEFTFENLNRNTQYNIKVETKDSAGNIGYEEKQVKTEDVTKLTEDNTNFVFSTDEYTNDSIQVTVYTDEEGYQVQTSQDGVNWNNTNTQEYTENGLIYVRLVDENGQTGEALTKTIDLIDKLNPTGTLQITKTSKSINVKVNAKDQEETETSAKSGIKGYYYSIDNGESYTELQEDDVYEFDNLPQATEYEIKVKVEDNAGNTVIISKSEQTEEIPDEAVTLSDILWNSETHEASVIVNTSAIEYTLQYAVDRNEWIDIDSGTRTEEYPLGTTIYARLWDGVNESPKYTSIKITDNIAPTTPTLEIINGTIGENNWYISNVEVAVIEGVDNQSGVKNTIYTLSGAMTREETEITSGESIIIKKNGETTITAYTYDNAGNVSEVAVLKVNREINKPEIEEATATSSKITIKATSSKSKINGYTVTRNSTVPTEFTSCNPTYELNVEIDNNLQAKEYYIWAKDEAGHVSDYKKITMDTIPTNTITIKDIAWNKNTHKACVTIETTTTGYMMQYSTDRENWIDIISGNKTQEYDVNTTIYARLYDGTNESLDRYESLKIKDTIEPTSPSIEIVDGIEGNNNWYTSDVEVQITEGVDIQCGVEKTTYILTGAQTQEETEIDSGDTIIIENDGITTITAYTYDNVGNRSNPTEIIVKKDETNPVKGLIEIISGTEGINDWYTSDVKVQIIGGTDVSSDVARVTYILEGATVKEETEIENKDVITISNNGITTIRAYTYDNAGNRKEADALIVKKDEILPEVALLDILQGVTGENGWYTSDVKVEITGGTDQHSDVQKITYILEGAEQQEETEIESGSIITISNDGITTITAYTYDNAGNRSNPTELVVKKDATNPESASLGIVNGEEGINGWYTSDVKVQITSGTDDTSNVAKLTYVLEGAEQQEETEIESGSIITISNNGITTIKAYTYDISGNRSEVETITVKKDEINPSEASLRIASGTAGTNGWYASDIGVQVTSGTDAHSNVQKITYVLEGAQTQVETAIENNGIITIENDGSTKITAYTYDNAGNRSNPVELTVYKDETKPVVTNETAVTTDVITIKANEATSGIIGYTVTETTAIPTIFTSCENTKRLEVEVGEKTQNKDYYVWVKDAAGNISNYKQVTTNSIPTGTITLSNIAWNANTHKASVTVTTSATGYILQYSIDRVNWHDITSGTKTEEYPLNTIVYARLWDGTNESSDAYANIKITDTELPTMPRLEISGGTLGTNGWYTSSIDVKATIGEDHQSDVQRVTYVLSGAQTQAETEITSGQNLTITADGETTITAYTYDNAGNRSEGRILKVKKDQLAPVVTNETSATTNTIKIRATDAMSGVVGYTVTDTTTIPTTFTQCIKTDNLTAEFSGLTQNKDYYVWVKDEAGIVSNYRVIRTSPVPTGTITINDIVWNSNTHNASVTISTTTTGYTLQYSTDRVNWYDITSGSKTREYSLGTTVYARLWDGVNESTDTYANLKITDGEIPNSPKVEIISGTEGINNWYWSNVVVKVTEGTDYQSGVARTTYTLSGATTQAETTIANNGTITISNDGITTITAYTYDNAGNKSNAGTVVINKDIVNPSKPTLEFVSGTTKENGWYNSNVVYRILTGMDATSGVQKLTYTLEALDGGMAQAEREITSGSNITISTDGITKITTYTYDSAGHKSEATVITVKKDTTKPTITNFTSATTCKITLNATDASSGIVGYAISTNTTTPTSFTACTKTKELTVDIGSRTQTTNYYLWVKDEAGHISDRKDVRTAEVPNAVTISDISWNTSTHKASVKLTEGVSGYTVQYSTDGSNWTNIANGGRTPEYSLNTTVYGRLFDGTNASKIPPSFKITDTTKPNQPTVAVTAGTGGTNSWYTSNVTVKITAGADNQSGVKKTTYTLEGATTKSETEITSGGTITISNEGTTTIKAYTYDYAENKSDVTTLVVKKDVNKPNVLSTTSATTNTITIRATDDTSGIIGYAVTGSTTQPSSFTSCTNTKSLNVEVGGRTQNADYYVWVKDEAGLVSSYRHINTQAIPTGTITIAKSGWDTSTSKARVRISTSTSGYTLQYTTTPNNASSWANISSGGYTGYNYPAGTTIYARLSDGTNTNYASGYAQYTVTKDENTLTLSAYAGGTLNAGASTTFTVITNTSGGTLSVVSSNTNRATVSRNGNTITVTAGSESGDVTITVTSAETGIYYSKSAQYSINIKGYTACTYCGGDGIVTNKFGPEHTKETSSNCGNHFNDSGERYWIGKDYTIYCVTCLNCGAEVKSRGGTTDCNYCGDEIASWTDERASHSCTCTICGGTGRIQE